MATFPLFEVESLFEFTGDLSTRGEFNMITRIWHGAIPAANGDEYLNQSEADANGCDPGSRLSATTALTHCAVSRAIPHISS